MDPLVFSIMTSESESASGSAMKVHPGDCAAPLDILEWLDKFDEKIESTSYGQVRRGQIPDKCQPEASGITALLRSVRFGLPRAPRRNKNSRCQATAGRRRSATLL